MDKGDYQSEYIHAIHERFMWKMHEESQAAKNKTEKYKKKEPLFTYDNVMPVIHVVCVILWALSRLKGK